MKYKQKRDSRFSHVKIKTFVTFIHQEFKKGGITPEAIVEKATPKDSIAHDLFEWDDRKAAHEYRVVQARQYLRTIVIDDGSQTETRAFYNVTIGDHQEYVPLHQAVHTPTLWKQVVEQALIEAESWSRRYEKYLQLQPIHKAIQKVKQQQERKHETKERKNQRAA